MNIITSNKSVTSRKFLRCGIQINKCTPKNKSGKLNLCFLKCNGSAKTCLVSYFQYFSIALELPSNESEWKNRWKRSWKVSGKTYKKHPLALLSLKAEDLHSSPAQQHVGIDCPIPFPLAPPPKDYSVHYPGSSHLLLTQPAVTRPQISPYIRRRRLNLSHIRYSTVRLLFFYF